MDHKQCYEAKEFNVSFESVKTTMASLDTQDAKSSGSHRFLYILRLRNDYQIFATSINYHNTL